MTAQLYNQYKYRYKGMKQHIVRSNKRDLAMSKQARSSRGQAWQWFIIHTYLTQSHTEKNVKEKGVVNCDDCFYYSAL